MTKMEYILQMEQKVYGQTGAQLPLNCRYFNLKN
jgi:hypothetical protein